MSDHAGPGPEMDGICAGMIVSPDKPDRRNSSEPGRAAMTVIAPPGEPASTCAEQKSARVLGRSGGVPGLRLRGRQRVGDRADRGISKAIYRHFPDKSALFAAVVRAECARRRCISSSTGRAPPPDFLYDLAREAMEFNLSDFRQGIYRIAVAQIERFPDIGKQPHRIGPQPQPAGAALAAATEQGEARRARCRHAARVFFAICKAGISHQRLFSVGRPRARRKSTRMRVAASGTFLRAFGYRSPASRADGGGEVTDRQDHQHRPIVKAEDGGPPSAVRGANATVRRSPAPRPASAIRRRRFRAPDPSGTARPGCRA